MSDYLPTWRQGLWIAARALVFFIGGVTALLYAVVLNSFWTNQWALRVVEIIAFLGLALAAPVCFCLATFGSKGDRWTIGYVIAWLAYIATYCAAALVARIV
ncbi:MAG: hypothetical protein LC808_03845 [Actinobacteria bacterium]|nr:hypothetical protein [Actinomycetota bacterium]